MASRGSVILLVSVDNGALHGSQWEKIGISCGISIRNVTFPKRSKHHILWCRLMAELQEILCFLYDEIKFSSS